MQQIHIAGDKHFDNAGSTVPLIDAPTGEITQVQIFVATRALFGRPRFPVR